MIEPNKLLNRAVQRPGEISALMRGRGKQSGASSHVGVLNRALVGEEDCLAIIDKGAAADIRPSRRQSSSAPAGAALDA